MDFHLEQVQDFTPTPMTVSTETWYTGYDPYTLEPVFSAKTPREKLAQRQFFFWYKPEERRAIEQELRRIGRADLIAKLYAGVPAPNRGRNFGNNRRPEFERREMEDTSSGRYRSAGEGRNGKHSEGRSGGYQRNSNHGTAPKATGYASPRGKGRNGRKPNR